MKRKGNNLCEGKETPYDKDRVIKKNKKEKEMLKKERKILVRNKVHERKMDLYREMRKKNKKYIHMQEE